MLRINHPENYGSAAHQLEPVPVVDRWHRCEVCGDIIEPGTTALEDPAIGLIHECCEGEAGVAAPPTPATRRAGRSSAAPRHW